MGRILTPLGVLLMLVAAGLAAVIYTELRGPSRGVTSPALPVEAAPVVESAPPASFRLPDLDYYAEVVERPLFRDTRRPPEEEEEAAVAEKPPAEATAKKLDYVLTGVMMTPERRLAFLKSTAKGEAKRIKQGDTLDGWLVKLVQSKRVVLSRGARSQVLKLQVVPETAPRTGKPTPDKSRPGTRRPPTAASRTGPSRAAQRRARRPTRAAARGQPMAPPNAAAPGPPTEPKPAVADPRRR